MSLLDVEALRLACSQYAHQRTVQLFDARRRTFSNTLALSPLATGVLLAHRERRMLVTSAHVLDSPEVQERGLYVLGNEETIDMGDFSFTRTHSTEDRLIDDDIDLAVVFLGDEVAERLQTVGGFEFCTITETTTGSTTGGPYDSLLFVHGYPLGLTYVSARKRHVDRASLAVFVSPYDHSRGVWQSAFADSHIDLDYKPTSMAAHLQDGGGLSLPEPHGFSGCGLWHVAVPTHATTIDEAALVLIGIVHRFSRELGVLRASRLEVLVRIIDA